MGPANDDHTQTVLQYHRLQTASLPKITELGYLSLDYLVTKCFPLGKDFNMVVLETMLSFWSMPTNVKAFSKVRLNV